MVQCARTRVRTLSLSLSLSRARAPLWDQLVSTEAARANSSASSTNFNWGSFSPEFSLDDESFPQTEPLVIDPPARVCVNCGALVPPGPLHHPLCCTIRDLFPLFFSLFGRLYQLSIFQTASSAAALQPAGGSSHQSPRGGVELRRDQDRRLYTGLRSIKGNKVNHIDKSTIRTQAVKKFKNAFILMFMRFTHYFMNH